MEYGIMKSDVFAFIKLTEQEKVQIQKDLETFDLKLEQLEKRVPNKENGFFGRGSLTWKLYRNPFILLGGMRALLLQIAHPAVAEGVKLFSNFHEEYLYRAHHTFTSMSTLFFGDTQQAIKTARHLYRMHSMIRGTFESQNQGGVVCKKFIATNPELLCWVLATLVDTTLVIYEKVYAPLSLEEKEQFFQESKITASLMGIPIEKYPDNLYHFYLYYNTMLRSDQLEIGETALSLSKIILHPPYFGHRLLTNMAKGSLPLRFARAYGLKQNRRSINRFERLIWIARIIYKITPRFLHLAPPYHQAQYRIAQSKKKCRLHIGRIYNWLGKVCNFPFVLKEIHHKKL